MADQQLESTAAPGAIYESKAYANPHEGATAEKLAAEERPGPGMHEVPLRQYLDTNVVPILLPGLNAVAEERPENPVEWLAHYLLKNNPMNKNSTNAATSPEQQASGTG